MELHEALTEIASIRRQIARAEAFHGYRAITVAAGALLAFIGAIVQPAIVFDPSRDLQKSLILWISLAIVAAVVPAVDVWRQDRDGWSLRSSLARLAYEQFAPCVLAGGLVTAVVSNFQPHLAWMLPGVWAVIFSLGLFASFRLLPRAIAVVAVWYLFTGCLCLALGPIRAGLAPWTMALTFGIGQSATAVALLRQSQEGCDGE